MQIVHDHVPVVTAEAAGGHTHVYIVRFGGEPFDPLNCGGTAQMEYGNFHMRTSLHRALSNPKQSKM